MTIKCADPLITLIKGADHLSWMKNLKTLMLGLLAIHLSACGGDSNFECTPSPVIQSTPPIVATAGFRYVYFIDASYTCGILGLLCNNVVGSRMPEGAVIDDYPDTLTWSPKASQVGMDIAFAIATEPDFCGKQVAQSWAVHVYGPPVIESFFAARPAVSPGEATTITAIFEGNGRIEGIGPVSSGVVIDTPALSDSTDFTLIVANSIGAEISSEITIAVLEPPVINSLWAIPDIITVGDHSELRWNVAGNFSVARIDPISEDVLLRRTLQVTPTFTTTYTLYLANETGASTSASVKVEVVDPPIIESFTATPTSSILRGAVSLTAQYQNGIGEIKVNDYGGHYVLLSPVVTGETVSTGELLRSTRFRLEVKNAAGTEVMQNLFVPITGPGTFQPASGQPVYPLRGKHSATRLADGRVFIAGGRAGNENIVATEIFDPISDTFTAGADLLEGRHNHADALLPDGRVLLVGGHRSDSTRILNAEIYDPGSNTVTSAGLVPASDIISPQAVNLKDGRILVVHSSRGQGAEVFDSITETFTRVGPFNESHACIRVERLLDGKALVIDGRKTTPSEIFTPGSDSFAVTDSMLHNRCYFNSAVLQDGRVLITGGSTTSVPAEIYDPVNGKFAEVETPQYLSSNSRASLLDNGSVLIVGRSSDGGSSHWAELFDPITNTFTATGGLRDGHRFHTATVLQDGRVLVLGGCNQSPCDAELYTQP